jgi:hypothetical protein
MLLIGLTGCGSSHGPPAAAVTAQPTSTATTTSASTSLAPGKHYRPKYGPHADRFIDLDWLEPRRGWALVGRACGAAHNRCATVYGTRDGGQTWSRLTPDDAFCPRPSTCVTGLRFVSSRVGYLYGFASFVTTDGGRTWAPLPGPQVESVACSGYGAFRLKAPCAGSRTGR